MHKHGIITRFLWISWDLHFHYFLFEKGGTLKQRAITYSPNEFIFEYKFGMCSGDPQVHQDTHEVKFWGGAGLPPSAP